MDYSTKRPAAGSTMPPVKERSPAARSTRTKATVRTRTRQGRIGRSPTTDVAETVRQAALELFADQNYATVTIKDIAHRTGINTSLIYYYFRNKEEVFLSVIESTVQVAFEKFEALKAQADTPSEIIRAWIEIHIVQFHLLQKLAKMSLDYAGRGSRTRRIDRAIGKFYDLEAVVLQRCIQDGIDRGDFRPVDAAEMATFVSTFLDGSLFRAVMFPKFNHKVAIDHMRRVVLGHLQESVAGARHASGALPDRGRPARS